MREYLQTHESANSQRSLSPGREAIGRECILPVRMGISAFSIGVTGHGLSTAANLLLFFHGMQGGPCKRAPLKMSQRKNHDRE